MLCRVRTTFLQLLAIAALATSVASCDSSNDQPAVSGADSETVLVHGVVDKNGKPVSGAQVWLTLWPEDDDTPDGGVVDTRSEHPVTTGDDGRFVLSLDPDRLESRYFNGDFLNFDIEVWGDGQLGRWGSTVELIEDRFWRGDDEDRIADDALQIDFDLGTKPTVTLETLDAPDEHELMLMPSPKRPS